MARRMPILGQHDLREALGETIDQGNYLVPVRDRQPSARTEVILNVNDDQDIVIAERDSLRAQASCSSSCRRRSNASVRFIKATPTCTGYGASGPRLRKGSGKQ